MFIVTFYPIDTVWYFSTKETWGTKFRIQTAIKKGTRTDVNAFNSKLNNSVRVQILKSPEVSVSKEHRDCMRMKLEYSNMGVCTEEKTAEHCSYCLLILLIHVCYYFLIYYLLINKAKGFKTESVVFKLH